MLIRKSNYFNSAFILILLVGYILMSFLPDIIGTSSRIVTIPFRGLVLFLSLYILARGIIWKGHKTFPAWHWLFFIAFWTIYLFRIIYDLYYVGIKATVFPSHSDYLLNALGVCLIPAAAIRYADDIDYSWVLNWFYMLLFIALAFSLLLNLSDDPLNEEVTRQGQYNGSSAMNTISYGHYGVTFALLSMFQLSKSEILYKKLLYTAGFFFGLFIMYLAGSRSPLVALVVCVVFFQINYTGFVKGILIISVLVLPLIVFGEQIAELLSGFGGSFINRVLSTVNSGNSSGRDLLYTQAYEEFLSSPLFGNAFLLQGGIGTGFYPHNIVLEVLMALGLFGISIFVLWISKCLYVSYKLIASSNDNAWAAVLFLQYLIYAMFSQAIFNNAGIWYYSILILNIAYVSLKEEKVNRIIHFKNIEQKLV